MRILHVGKYYPPARGGMETALRHMVEGLSSLGHEVRVLVAGHGRRTVREDLPGAAGALVRAGVAGHWNSQPLTLTLPPLLAREIAAFTPDIVHLHTPNPLGCLAWLTGRPRRRDRRPVLAVWHHSDIVRQRVAGRLVRPVVARCLEEAAGISVSSAALRTSSVDLAPYRARVRVIPFGIDVAPFAAEPAGDGPFLFVGRLVPYKGLDVLLDAVTAVEGARLDIVGDGPMRPALEATIGQRGLASRVRLLGSRDDAEVAALLARARAVVLPSRDHSETFGLVLLEAMAAGVPLITSDLPTGVAELNRDGVTGWTVPPGDAGALARALADATRAPDEARRRGATGRRDVIDRYTVGRMAGDLGDWYAELLADRAGTDALAAR